MRARLLHPRKSAVQLGLQRERVQLGNRLLIQTNFIPGLGEADGPHARVQTLFDARQGVIGGGTRRSADSGR